MPKILVDKAFNLILRTNSDKLSFAPGLHDVDDDIAAHWYVRENATVLDGKAPAPAVSDSDGRRAIIDRLVALFRVHVEGLSVEALAEMLASAEARQSAEAESAEGPALEPEAEAQAEPEAEQAPETVEPGAEDSDPEAEETAPEFDPELYDLMTEDELRAHLTQRDGKAPDGRWGLPKLLKAAKGEQQEAESAEA